MRCPILDPHFPIEARNVSIACCTTAVDEAAVRRLRERFAHHEIEIFAGRLTNPVRGQAVQAVNAHLIETYWQVGRHIMEFEQAGKAKAEYGAAPISNLAKDLSLRHGRGSSRSNLIDMRLLFLRYPIGQKPSHQLSWSHYSDNRHRSTAGRVHANMQKRGESAMHEQIDVVYENGVLRPLGPLPYPLEEHQQFTVILEGSARGRDWLADADPSIRLARRSMLLSAPTLLHFDQKNSTSEIHV